MNIAPRHALVLPIFLLLTGSALARPWPDPAGFFENEKIKVEELQPGLTWIAASGRLNGNPLRTHIVAVDLSRPDLSLQALVGARFAGPTQFFLRSRTSQLQEDNDALAAINVAFFDIGATQAPQGLLLRNGQVLREPSPDRPNFISLPNGRAAIANLGWEARVRVGDRRRPLTGVNRPNLGDDDMVLYLPPWVRSPGNAATFVQRRNVLELLVEKTGFEPASTPSGRARMTGRVIELRENRGSVKIEENQFVLTAPEGAAALFQNVGQGTVVEVNWRLTNAPAGIHWNELREAVSAGPILVRDGKKQSADAVRHPRSAAGISRDGRQVLLVLVDGRSTDSAGIGLADLADYLIHLGAHEAINFDGGGSSALAARVKGRNRVLNNPSDSNERYVPTGLGVVLALALALAEESLDRPRVWTGENGRTMSGLFQDYHAPTEQVTLILDGRRYTLPLSSLSEPDQALIRRAHPDP